MAGSAGNGVPARQQRQRSDRPSLVLLRRAEDYLDELDIEASLPCISTGFRNLDEQLGGGLRARLISTLVAATGRGKTSFATQLAARHAEGNGPVLYYSAELTGAQLIARLLGQRTDTSWRQVLNGELTREFRRAVLEPLRFYVVGRVPNPLDVLEATSAELARQGDGQVLLVVDYAQLVTHARDDMRLGVMDVVNRLLAMTQAHHLVTLVLAQGNRSSTNAMRAGEGMAEEFIGAAGETSAIEQESANVMCLLYQPRDGARVHDVTVAVAKARLNCSGKVGLRFHGASGRWEELDAAPVPPAEQARRDRVIAVLHPSEPKTRNQIIEAAGLMRKPGLDTIRQLIAGGLVREVPGGGILHV